MSVNQAAADGGGKCRFPAVTARTLALAVVATLLAGILAADAVDARAANSADVAKVTVTPARPNRPNTFRDRLVVGLKARLKSELAFIDAVVAAVNTGRLPARLVDQTYFWARSRAANTWYSRSRRPIVYFQPAMKARAKRLRVVL